MKKNIVSVPSVGSSSIFRLLKPSEKIQEHIGWQPAPNVAPCCRRRGLFLLTQPLFAVWAVLIRCPNRHSLKWHLLNHLNRAAAVLIISVRHVSVLLRVKGPLTSISAAPHVVDPPTHGTYTSLGEAIIAIMLSPIECNSPRIKMSIPLFGLQINQRAIARITW